MDHTDISTTPAKLITVGVAAFVVLALFKICEMIAWSWWWIVSPLLLPLGVCVAVSIALWRTYHMRRKKPVTKVRKLPTWLR